jgi:hypothetical protein
MAPVILLPMTVLAATSERVTTVEVRFVQARDDVFTSKSHPSDPQKPTNDWKITAGEYEKDRCSEGDASGTWILPAQQSVEERMVVYSHQPWFFFHRGDSHVSEQYCWQL